MGTQNKDNKWYIKGAIKQDDGTFYHYTKLVKDCNSKKEANEYDREFQKQYQAIQISKTKIAFKQACDEFLSQHKNIKTSTKISKQEIYRKIDPYIGSKKINLISTKALQNMIDDLEAQDLSVEYVKRIYCNTNQVFKYLVRVGKLTLNPMADVTRHTKKDELKKEIEFWEPEQFKLFIDLTKPEIKWYAIFNFLYFTGMRRGEVAALRWTDINLKTGVIKIYKTMSYKERPAKETTPKTKNSIRTIRMPKVLIKVMQNYYGYCKGLYGFTDDFYVFGHDRPIDPETLRRKLSHYIKITNTQLEKDNKSLVPIIHVHSFRHSHASYLINKKMYDYDIAKRLGDTVTTVRETYAHWFVNAEDDLLASFDNF